MSKLQILIPQYNENEDTIKPLLDSIQFQEHIDLKNDIEVFIGNDGSDTKLSVDFLKQYSFRIQYHYFEHARLAATRQKLLDLATADYIMFCDADDHFISTIALNIILLEADRGFDILVSDFYTEYNINGKCQYYLYHDDPIFVHGKVYNRRFLLENEIIWHKELHEHQDSAFNILARTCAKKTGIINMPLYLWCSNPNSISRKNKEMHSPMTWPHMIDSYDALVGDLQNRGLSAQSAYYAKYCLYATYYEMAHVYWTTDEGKEYVSATYKRLSEFYNKYRLLIRTVNEKMTQQMIKVISERAPRKGKMVEMPPFDDWLNSILTIYK